LAAGGLLWANSRCMAVVRAADQPVTRPARNVNYVAGSSIRWPITC